MTAPAKHGNLHAIQPIEPASMFYSRDRAKPMRLTPIAALTWAANASSAPLETQPGGVETLSNAGELFTQAFFLKMGFSFMIGLAMGFALKVAFKIALVMVGLTLIALFALQYNGFILIDWSGMEPHYDSIAHGMRTTGAAFLDFAAHNLTSAASFFAGLAIGLKL